MRLRRSRARGFREVPDPVRVTGGAALVTSYESLTMAAQFEPVRLPRRRQRGLRVEVRDGTSCGRVVQMFDSDLGSSGQTPIATPKRTGYSPSHLQTEL